jgi:hypothetical protein
MTPKPDGFRALGVKQPKDLLTQVKKATKLNLAILSSNPNFTLFDANTQCLIRQEARLLSEKFKFFNIILFLSFFFYFYFYFYFYAKVIPPISYPTASKILITDITNFKFHTPPTMC